MPNPTFVPVLQTGADVEFGDLAVTGAATVGGTLAVTGASTFTGAAALNGGGTWAGLLDGTGAAASTSVIGTLVAGDTVDRFRLRADGRIDLGPGGAAARDTNLYRGAANLLTTDDKFTAALGIGVGNSAAATTLGSVARRMEVFDAAGASIGFVPIYNAIT